MYMQINFYIVVQHKYLPPIHQLLFTTDSYNLSLNQIYIKAFKNFFIFSSIFQNNDIHLFQKVLFITSNIIPINL